MATHKIVNLKDPSHHADRWRPGGVQPFLPVRSAPHEDAIKLESGWDSENYSIITDSGTSVLSKNKECNGIEISPNTEVTLVEIVQSQTGTWYGFTLEETVEKANLWTENFSKVLYAKSEYFESFSNQDFPLSKKITNKQIKERGLELPLGAKLIDPGSNLNWKKIDKYDVKLAYYNFNEFNRKIASEKEQQLIINSNTINTNPTLRYSEGLYYFIVDDGHRKSSSELSLQGTSSETKQDKKTTELIYSENFIKIKAFDALLRSLGKDMSEETSFLRLSLEAKYFANVSKHVSTSTTDPNNQKMLFAIPASYIDGLPDSNLYYGSNFDSDFEPDIPYMSGNNYAFSIRLSELDTRINNLIKVFRKLKSRIEQFRSSAGVIKNPNNIDFDVDEQIKAFEEFPNIINEFLINQGVMNHTDDDLLSGMMTEGAKTDKDHLLLIGLRDNGVIGTEVRQTISYIIFSPDYKVLSEASADSSKFNLFELDPYLTKKEIDGSVEAKRSGVALKKGLPWLRSKFEGVQGTRVLHYLMAHQSMITYAEKYDSDFKINDWVKFLQKYSVPPLLIELSKEKLKEEEAEDIDCVQLIEQFQKQNSTITDEERNRQKRILNSPKCREAWLKAKRKNTSAADSEFTKGSIEGTSKTVQGVSRSPGEQNLKLLYESFLHHLNPQALLTLLLACLQKQLGIPITAEAICEVAILKLIESVGVEEFETMLVLADPSLAPKLSNVNESTVPALAEETDIYDEEGSYIGSYKVYKDAPIAAATAMTTDDVNYANKIKNHELTGQEVRVVPNPELDYTWADIRTQKAELRERGYSETEATAILVKRGYLNPDRGYYESAVDETFIEPADRLAGSLQSGRLSNRGGFEAGRAINAHTRNAKQYLNYLNGFLSLTDICELVVGPLLEIPGLLFSDPDEWVGNFENWGGDFVDRLKRQFVPPDISIPTMTLPDDLSTDDMLGDFADQMLKAFLAMVGTLLGQILSLLLQEVISKCFEEDSDTGQLGESTRGKVNVTEKIPKLDLLNAISGLGDVGNLNTPAALQAMVMGLLDSLTTGQICALLRGDATQSTLNQCLSWIKYHASDYYDAGIDSTTEIVTMFKAISEEINLDICDVIEATAPIITDACDATYDYDARCAELQAGGLTKEECDDQIKREIEDLKNKVGALANFLFPNSNPLGDAFPSMCGPQGLFVLPPVVRDRMAKITNNLLYFVKRGVISDLQNLEFFSVPPSAILAATDADHMQAAIDDITRQVTEPNSVQLLAYAGGSGTNETTYKTSERDYHLTYGVHRHYVNTKSSAALNGEFSNFIEGHTHGPSLITDHENEKSFKPIALGHYGAREWVAMRDEFYPHDHPDILDKIINFMEAIIEVPPGSLNGDLNTQLQWELDEATEAWDTLYDYKEQKDHRQSAAVEFDNAYESMVDAKVEMIRADMHSFNQIWTQVEKTYNAALGIVPYFTADPNSLSGGTFLDVSTEEAGFDIPTYPEIWDIFSSLVNGVLSAIEDGALAAWDWVFNTDGLAMKYQKLRQEIEEAADLYFGYPQPGVAETVEIVSGNIVIPISPVAAASDVGYVVIDRRGTGGSGAVRYYNQPYGQWKLLAMNLGVDVEVESLDPDSCQENRDRNPWNPGSRLHFLWSVAYEHWLQFFSYMVIVDSQTGVVIGEEKDFKSAFEIFRAKVYESYDLDIKPLGLEKLLFTTRHFQDFQDQGFVINQEGLVVDTSPEQRIAVTPAGISYQKEPGGSHSSFIPDPAEVHPLHTRLIDINNNFFAWQQMLTMFTGVEPSWSFASDDEAEQGTIGVGGNKAMWIVPAFDKGEDRGTPKQNQLYRISPGVKYLADKKPLHGDIYSAFVNLTVGEALGLIDKRMKKMYPKIPVFSIEGVVFKWGQAQFQPWTNVTNMVVNDSDAVIEDYFDLESMGILEGSELQSAVDSVDYVAAHEMITTGDGPQIMLPPIFAENGEADVAAFKAMIMNSANSDPNLQYNSDLVTTLGDLGVNINTIALGSGLLISAATGYFNSHGAHSPTHLGGTTNKMAYDELSSAVMGSAFLTEDTFDDIAGNREFLPWLVRGYFYAKKIYLEEKENYEVNLRTLQTFASSDNTDVAAAEVDEAYKITFEIRTIAQEYLVQVYEDFKNQFADAAAELIVGTGGQNLESLAAEDYISYDSVTQQINKLIIPAGYQPLFIAFTNFFRNPASPFEDADLIDNLSLENSLVNRDLFNGLGPPEFSLALDHSFGSALNFGSNKTYNPNFVKTHLPFTEVVFGDVLSTGDVSDVTKNIFGRLDPGIRTKLEGYLSEVQSLNQNNSLIYQNYTDIKTPELRDKFKLIKANVAEDPLVDRFVHPVKEDTRLVNEIYNFDFHKKYDDDVKDLLNKIGITSQLDIDELYDQNLMSYSEGARAKFPDSVSFNVQPGSNNSVIFGQLLAHKLEEYMNEYSAPAQHQSAVVFDGQLTKQEFLRRTKYALSSYGYSSLNYAYYSQMFMKLKNSRLQYRKYLKKVWNKVLKNPLSNNKVDEYCQQVFNQLEIPTKRTETDFFNIDEVKPKILEFYEKSICRDVYDDAEEGYDAVKKSLLEGCIMLLVKIYSLEMCMAGVISWDSFDIAEIARDDIFVKVVISNIKKSISGDAFERLVPLANDIVRKVENIDDQEFFLLTNEISSLEYLIKKQGEIISGIIKKLFINSSSINLDLELDIVKSSAVKIDPSRNLADITENSRAQIELDERTQLYEQGGYDYVASAKFIDNIYTMNYGNAYAVPSQWQGANYSAGYVENQAQHARNDIFNLYDRHPYAYAAQRHRFHTMPLTHWTGDDLAFLPPHGAPPSNNPGPKWEIPWYHNPDFPGGEKQYYSLWEKRAANRLALINASHDSRASHVNHYEWTFTTQANKDLGNITFQPYVKIVDATSEDFLGMSALDFINYATPPGSPCELTVPDVEHITVDLPLPFLQEYREENNLFGCHMFGYVPLHAWSYFYNHVFLEEIRKNPDTYGKIFEKFGLRAFFKEIKFGIRMVYSNQTILHKAWLQGTESDGYVGMHYQNHIEKFVGTENLKKNKCLVNKRRSNQGTNTLAAGLNELQIPIIEVEKNINLFTSGFSIDGGEILSYNEMGGFKPSSGALKGIGENTTIETLLSDEYYETIKFHTNNPQQLFYKKMAKDLTSQLKNSPEFKLVFDHLIPVRRYMTMAFLYATDGLSKYYSEPTKVLEETKKAINTTVQTLLNSDDYTYEGITTDQQLELDLMGNNTDTRAKGPDMSMLAIKMILRTPLLILKGFVEITDPAIILSKKIIDIANALALAIISGIEQGLRASQMAIEASLNQAKAALMQEEMNIQSAGLSVLQNKWDNLDPQIKEDNFEGQLAEDNVMSVDLKPGASLPPELLPEWNSVKAAAGSYGTALASVQGIQQDLDETIQTLNETLEDAKELVEQVRSSPYALAGLWAAMMPSQLPYLGGLTPPPLPGGPPSTIPGMIYLVLMFLDALEEKQHSEMQDEKNTGDDACLDQL